MRVSSSFIAASLLMALFIAQAHAAKSGCPSADKVKNPACSIKDEQSGMDVCKYRITTGADKTWVGEDPSELGKDGGKVSVKFQTSETKNNTLYCDYQLTAGGRSAEVRLSLEKP